MLKLKPNIQLFAESDLGADPQTEPAGGKTYTQEYVSALRNEAKGHRVRANTAESALRTVFGLKDTDDLGDVNARLTAYQQAQTTALNEAITKANNLLISAAIKGKSEYDTDLLEQLIDRSKITVEDDGTMEGLDEAITAVETKFPVVKKTNVPNASRSTPGLKETGDKKEQANRALRQLIKGKEV